MTNLTFSSTKRILCIKNPVSLNYYKSLTDSVDFNQSATYLGFFVESGSLTLFVNDKVQILSPDNFYLLTPNTPYRFQKNSDENINFLSISFNCYSDVLTAIEGYNIIDETEKSFINSIICEIKKQVVSCTNEVTSDNSVLPFCIQQLIVACIESLLINMIRKKLANNPELLIVSNASETRKNCANQIKEFLFKNVYNNISLNDVKNNLFYSKTYLNNAFKKETGYSIISYYKLLKIEEAKRLISTGEQIVVIAEKLNFDSPSNFYKVFKSITGITTSQFKKQIED